MDPPMGGKDVYFVHILLLISHLAADAFFKLPEL